MARMKEKADRLNPRYLAIKALERVIELAEPLGVPIPQFTAAAISLYLEGMSAKKVAIEMGIEECEAHELLRNGIYNLKEMQNALARAVKEDQQLREENAMLKDENTTLRKLINRDDLELIISQQRLKREMKGNKTLQKKLSMSIYELDLNNRMRNKLKAGDIYTLGDIVKYKRSFFENFPSFGVKALNDLDKVIEEAGLSYEKE